MKNNHELESWMRGMYAALFRKQYAIPSGMDAEAYAGGYAAGSARHGQLEAELAEHRVDSAVARLRLLASSRRENSISAQRATDHIEVVPPVMV